MAATTDIYIKTVWGGIPSFSDEQVYGLIDELKEKTGATGSDDDKGFTVTVPSHKASHAIDIATRHGFPDAHIEGTTDW
jgi:hypothetical protein